MGKAIYTPDNTCSYILIIITILLAYGLYKIYNAITEIKEQLHEKSTEVTIEEKIQDPGPSGVTIEEKNQEHLDSLVETDEVTNPE